MGPFVLVAVIFVVLIIGCFVFVYRHVCKFKAVARLKERGKGACWAIRIAVVIVLAALLALFTFDAVVLLIYLVVTWALFDLIGLFINKARGRKRQDNCIYGPGVAALAFIVLFAVWGAISFFHVNETHYELESSKVDDLRIVAIADSHLGDTMSGQRFAKSMEEVQASSPDAVVFVGDFVDDGSSWEDAQIACEALGKLKTTYGVYYVSGNHDKGMMNSRSFSFEQLESELQAQGVTVLQDQNAKLGDKALLIGRQDAIERDRASMEQLTKGVDKGIYTIVLDHQPADYDSQEASGVDLVLSGHTHGGQTWAVTLICKLLHINDQLYGLETRGTTNFIVSSGISDWALHLKTVTSSEYVVVDVK